MENQSLRRIGTMKKLGLVGGMGPESTIPYYHDIVYGVQEAIVLGCTELPLLLNDEVSSVPCLDTMQIHISSIVKTILDC
jgi:aspartate/glutamate racemase